MESLAVFCGSSFGNNPVYEAVAKEIGALLAQQNIQLIYGGGDIGLMGVVANTTLKEGGKVLGVIPDFLINIEGRNAIGEMIVVDTMHERKQIMAERADAFLIIPGGFGTMDEFFEILTWKQLRLHDKPIGVLNVNGFYDLLLAQFDKMATEGFVKAKNKELILVDKEIQQLIQKMQRLHKPIGKEHIERG